MVEKSITWNGGAVMDRMRKAEIAGVNRTMGAAVVHAKDNHPWKNQTGILEGSIDIVDYAAPIEDGVRGTWGAQDAVQARILELGGTIVPVKAKALAIPQPGGGVKFVRKVTIPAYPYLRPAADVAYPSLADNIRAAYEKSGGAAAEGSAPEGGGDA